MSPADVSARAAALGLEPLEQGGWRLLLPAAGGSFRGRGATWAEAFERALPVGATGPLAFPCERCRVGPGVKCRNYRGQGKQSCPARGRAAVPEQTEGSPPAAGPAHRHVPVQHGLFD